jgi:hypothetical protein
MGGELSNPQSFNPYVYADDSPTVLTDPTGLLTRMCIDYCGAFDSPSSPFSLAGAMVVMSGGDLHFHIGLSDYMGDTTGICYGCEPATGYDTELTTRTEPVSAVDSTSSGLDEFRSTTSESISNALHSDEPVSVVEYPRSNIVEDYESGGYRGEPIQMAIGKTVHGEFQGTANAEGMDTEVTAGNVRLDILRKDGVILEIKPYHEGIDPFEEYGGRVNALTEGYINNSGVPPTAFRFILYKLV